MKTLCMIPAVFSVACLLSACGNSDRYNALAQVVQQQNKTILDQQQTLQDQQQRLMNEEVSLAALTGQVQLDEQMLQQLQAPTTATAANPAVPSKIDPQKVSVVRSLAGFSARLSSSIGYDAYADALSDLNSNLVQGMLDMKDQAFVQEVNHILSLYNMAGDFWQRFASDGVDEINLNPVDRYKYASAGINFTSNYSPRASDVKKFWLEASNELQQLMDSNTEALGRDQNTVRMFAR